MLKRWKQSLVTVMLSTAGLVGCHKSDEPDAKVAAAKQLLSAFTKPDADAATLTSALQPKPEDYAAVFVGDAVQKVQAQQTAMWNGGKLQFKPSPEQTEIDVTGAPQPDLLNGTGYATHCNKGFREIASQINPTVVVYCFCFLKPGEPSGLHIDGLVHVNGHWALFVRPWLAWNNHKL